MDGTAVVAVAVVALALVLAGAAWRHRRGGISVDVRVWWSDRADNPPSDE